MVHLLVAMLLFAFFAISGLVIDLGLARVSQNRMAGAADTSAIEGLRMTADFSELGTRIGAYDMLVSNFAFKFGVTPPNDPRHFGAGPDVSVVGGVGSMDALGAVVVGSDVVYLPDLESNLGNADNGDMVRGFVDVDDPTPPSGAEASDYLRTDFTTTASPTLDDGFLVRLRRTPGTNPLDEQAGVASHGPALPYLFARGSFLAAGMRAAGISVRATAIAAARRAVMVGPNVVPPVEIGTAPFVLEFDYWNSIPLNSDFVVRFQGADILPTIVPPGELQGPGGELRGLLSRRTDLTRLSWSIGDNADPAVGWSESEILHRIGSAPVTFTMRYVPIYEADIGRIVGFGLIQQFVAADNGDGTWQLTIRKGPSRISARNASAVEMPGLAGLSSGLTQTVLGLLAQVDQPLRAAAIAR